LGSGGLLIASTLVIGGFTTYAAATASANSQLVSLGGSLGGTPDTDVTAATTTTMAPPTFHSIGGTNDPVSPGPDPASSSAVATQSIGVTVEPGSSSFTPSPESGGPGNPISQTIGVEVRPGPLTVTPASESAPLTPTQAFGQAAPQYRATLSPITVDDARGSLVGWRATVSLQTVSGLDAAQLASTRLCVSPHPTTLVAGNPADIVRSSPRACAGPGGHITVFSAAPGGGGGQYSDVADIVLVVPHGTVSAAATASFAVSVS
jgi:hypothetical protein